ncbi:MAG TPA: FecR family protein [Terriglobia bacterium]|nr:FecR family protein [Terriglobia bacterium]
MRCKALRHGFSLVVVGILIVPTILSAQQNLSHVRVVRLSYVSGTVGVKRPASTEWAKGQVNTPIQEGFELSTAANSYAEVEFENGSTARLGEFSKVNFDQLAMDQDGNKLNRLTFEQGYATFHFLPEHEDAYSVKIAETTLTPNGKSEFRTDLEHGRARVEVFAGSVELTAASQTVKLGKDKVLEFDPQATQVAFNAKPGIVKDSWDKWTSERDTQVQLSLADQAVSARGPLYGWSDLNAYGEWGYFPGFGYGWSPFATMGWSPYSMGMWSWYPGMGYAWISGEPWGWLPYHYGNWNFSSGFGWFWMPGSMGNWSPAMVSWYSGPGWVGWSPRGAIGAAGQSIVTTVPGGVIQNGQMIGPSNVNHMPVTAGTPIKGMPFQPGVGAMLSGPRLSANAEALFTPHAGASHSVAPTSILMGGDAEKEQSLRGWHLSHQPLRARLGTTLGGHYSVGNAVGEFRGNAFSGARGAGGPKGVNGPQGPGLSGGAGRSGPTILSHGQQSSGSSQGAGGGTMPSGGGGYGSSAPATMSTASSGHSASSGGGHH